MDTRFVKPSTGELRTMNDQNPEVLDRSKRWLWAVALAMAVLTLSPNAGYTQTPATAQFEPRPIPRNVLGGVHGLRTAQRQRGANGFDCKIFHGTLCYGSVFEIGLF